MEYGRLRTKIGDTVNDILIKHTLLPITIVMRVNPSVYNGYIISFRSKVDYIDCSKIVEKYGGGGHKQAASFRVHISELNRMIALNKSPLNDMLKYWEQYKKLGTNVNFEFPELNMNLFL